MAEGIKDKVAIIGMGCTRFGERWDAGAEDLIVEAFGEAMEDAGIEKKEIQAAWFRPRAIKTVPGIQRPISGRRCLWRKY